MIRTEREYQTTLTNISNLEASIPAERTRLLEIGCPEELLDTAMGPHLGRLAQLRQEAHLYQEIQNGDLSMFRSPEDDGLVLIAGRIARGWTQRELADRLGVSEAQVSRDEKNEYHGITLQRRVQLLRVLELSHEGHYTINRPTVELTSIRPKPLRNEDQTFQRAASMRIGRDEVTPRRKRGNDRD